MTIVCLKHASWFSNQEFYRVGYGILKNTFVFMYWTVIVESLASERPTTDPVKCKYHDFLFELEPFIHAYFISWCI